MFKRFIALLQWVLLEIKTLYHIVFSPIKGKTHKARLESFYKGQAASYDAYRKKLLHGRKELFKSLPKFEKGSVWVDLGAGTGSNVEYMAATGQLSKFSAVYLVDLSPSLLERARVLIRDNGWDNVHTVEADATTYRPKGEVDLVTFSYSLTMIPDWFVAVDHARNLLSEDGVVGIVDFYISRKYPTEKLAKHSWFTRFFWHTFFGFDNVNLNPDHLPYLLHSFDKPLTLTENKASVPYIPFLRVPYYTFVARKRV